MKHNPFCEKALTEKANKYARSYEYPKDLGSFSRRDYKEGYYQCKEDLRALLEKDQKKDIKAMEIGDEDKHFALGRIAQTGKLLASLDHDPLKDKQKGEKT